MSSSNGNAKPADNMELPKQEASACGAGCNCHAGGTAGRKRLILGTIVLLVAVALVARAVIKTNGTPSQPDTAGFALPTAAPAENTPAPSAAESEKAPSTPVAKEIETLAELNAQATALDAVFVYVPGKDGASGNPPMAAMKNAADRIGVQGTKIGLFTLKAGTRDHDLITTQMAAPGVLAAVKGRGGMIPITGEITETTLIQGFVAASSAGGCGPGGCGPAGCN